MDADNDGGVKERGKKGGRRETGQKQRHKTGEEYILLGDAELMYTTRTNWCFGTGGS